jgi:hypothetical protein
METKLNNNVGENINKTTLDYYQVSEFRKTALAIAKDLNPVNTYMQAGISSQNIPNVVTIEKLLSDADKIFEWLKKGF